ncbi:MAG: carboxypeptidase-like regulatory domain-containing protein, partial [Ignavibacterium sp.]|nr:carboxypeptidase-like regulatory domain-containing protein [Ignavibacterium sp.]
MSPVICFASNTGKIAGRVTDKNNGEPLVGANIYIQELSTGASTDINGDYYILNIPPGSYTITVSMVGYARITKSNVSVIIDRTTTVDFILETTLIEVEGVLIVAERPVIDKDLTASEQIVTGNILEKSGTKSIQDALIRLSGIIEDNSNLAWQRGSTKGYIRGSSNVQAVVMVDNLSVNSGLVSDNYTGFNTSTIEQISVLTGGYNAEYGEGRSAVVNIISKEAPKGIHGTLITRMRPAGVYHFGRNMYSTENNDYKSTDIDYWTQQSQDENSRFYQKNPDS